MDLALRPMSTSQVLDRTFQLYRNNFLLCAGVAIVGPAFSLIASFIQIGAFGLPVMPQPGEFDPVVLQKWLVQSIAGGVLATIFYTIGQAFATGATIFAISNIHLGKTTTIAESYIRIKPIFGRILRILLEIYWRAGWPMLTSYALTFVLIFGMTRITRGAGGAEFGFALLFLLGLLLSLAGIFGGFIWLVYIYCRYSLVIPACALEKLTPTQAMARGKFLAEGSVGRIVVIFLITIVMSSILTSVLQIPAYIFGGNIFSLREGFHISRSFMFWAMLGGFLGKALAGPIATIATALVYYDQRVRKEAFDLQLMMQALEPAAQAQAVPYSTTT
jgi:hypothetical protein